MEEEKEEEEKETTATEMQVDRGGGGGGGNAWEEAEANPSLVRAHDRWSTILAMHALQSILVHGKQASERLARVRVELPQHQNSLSTSTTSTQESTITAFTGLHLILLMSLPPRSIQTRYARVQPILSDILLHLQF
jgi:hypothetical protein